MAARRPTSALRPVTPPKRRTRNNPEERYREFVHKAIGLFAEVGFEAGTRELAQSLGVTQPLLYRYFPSKDDLIAAVYREIYVNRWKPQWREGLLDDGRPIRDRIIDFYEDYTRTIFTPEWLRIYLFAGLRRVEINQRYIAMLEAEIIRPIALATRESFGIENDHPLSAEELELFWTLQGSIFYYGVRQIVYGFEMQVDRETMIRNAVDTFLTGVGTLLKGVSDPGTAPAMPPQD